MSLRFLLRDYDALWPRAVQAVLIEGGEWYQKGQPCGFFPYARYNEEQLHKPHAKLRFNGEQFGYSAYEYFRWMAQNFFRDEEDQSRFMFSLDHVFEEGKDMFSPLEVLSALPARDFVDFTTYIRFLRQEFIRFQAEFGELTPTRVRDELLCNYEFHVDRHARTSTITTCLGEPSWITIESGLDKTTFANVLLHEITHGIMHRERKDPVTHTEARERCIDFTAAIALNNCAVLRGFTHALYAPYCKAIEKNMIRLGRFTPEILAKYGIPD